MFALRAHLFRPAQDVFNKDAIIVMCPAGFRTDTVANLRTPCVADRALGDFDVGVRFATILWPLPSTPLAPILHYDSTC